MKRSELLSSPRIQAATIFLWTGLAATVVELILGTFLSDRAIVTSVCRALLVWLCLGALHHGVQVVMIGYQAQDCIQGRAQKMINKVFASGELNEFKLIIHDLHLIVRSFIHLLTGIYHKRISFAEPNKKKLDEKTPNGEQSASTGENLPRLVIG